MKNEIKLIYRYYFKDELGPIIKQIKISLLRFVGAYQLYDFLKEYIVKK